MIFLRLQHACGGLAAGGVGILRRDDGKIARFQDDAATLGGFLIKHKVAVSIVSHCGLAEIARRVAKCSSPETTNCKSKNLPWS